MINKKSPFEGLEELLKKPFTEEDIKQIKENATKMANETLERLGFKQKTPKVGECNSCKGKVIAAYQSKPISEIRIGSKEPSSFISHYYCEKCLLMYHQCPNPQ